MYRSVLLLCIPCVYTQLDLDKSCNFTDLVTDVDVASTIAGSWYQLERIENTFETGDCSTATFTAVLLNGIPTALEFSNKEVVEGKLVYRDAYVTLSKNYLGVLNFTFTDGTSYDYVILPAKPYEYESLVLYSCQDNGNRSSVWAWKLGKNLTQSPEAKNATEKVIAAIDDLSNATWRTTAFGDEVCKSNGGLYLHKAMSSIFIIFLSISNSWRLFSINYI